MIYGKQTVGIMLLGAIGVTCAVLAEDPAEVAAFVEHGDVCFPHEMHFADFEIECQACHHETDAASLQSPHPEYFDDFWIDCTTCHKPRADPAASMACSTCHHDSPTSLADETLSSKVVIHKSCWQCHEVTTGVEASRSCSSCHNGKHHHPTDGEPGEEVPGS